MTSPPQAGERRCKDCGAPLKSDASGELCLRCALANALEPSVASATAAVEPSPTREIASHEQAPQPSTPGSTRFGDYELIEEIARGGMGVVYKARQRSLDRLVAVKMILFGAQANAEQVRRFRTEASAAGCLQHPNIVAVHEVGLHENQHYLVMDYVDGPNLGRLVQDGPLPATRAANYVKAIAEAVQYAHERGILHRDLKPSNVLIDSEDRPRVVDFGLAKRLSPDSSLTLSGQVLGSPSYMPPEQAGAGRGKVGRYSDVYSLGAILYHLLTGRPPFQAETVPQTLRLVTDAEPLSPRMLNPGVPQDLETICLKCLEKEPSRRYQAAQEIVEELDRFLRDEPILARPVSATEKAWRWCRRKPALASAIIAALSLLLVIAVGSPIAALRISAARQAEAKERHRAEGGLYAAQMKLAHAAFKTGKTGSALELLRAQASRFRGFEWRFLYGLCSNSHGEVLATNASGFASVDCTSDNRTVAFGTGDGGLQIFDLQQRRLMKSWQAHDGSIDGLALCARNANWLATVSGDDGLLKLWDVGGARAILSTNCSKGMFARVAFSPDGKYLMTGNPNARSLDLWHVQSLSAGGTPTVTLKTNFPFAGAAAFSPDDRTLALCNDPMMFFGIALYDLRSGASVMLPQGHIDLITCVAFSPDGSMLASGGADERVVLWDVKNRARLHSFAENEIINASALAFSPDGQTLFAGGFNPNIRFWNLKKPEETLFLQGHSAGVNSLAVSPDGALLASAGRDGTARLWSVRDTNSIRQSGAEFSALMSAADGVEPGREPQLVTGIAVSPNESRVAAAAQGRLTLYELRNGAELSTVAATNVFAPPTLIGSVAFSPDGKRLAVGGGDPGMVAFLDAVTLQCEGEPIRLHESQVSHIAFGLNGDVLITGGGLGTGIKLSAVPSGRPIKEFSGMEGNFTLQPLAVSRDGKLLATGSPDRSVCLRDIASGEILARSPHKVRFLHSVTFSPDGHMLAFADELGSIFLWDLSGKHPMRKLGAQRIPVLGLAFSPDGRTLASAGIDHTIKLWNPDIDQEVATLTGHSGWVWCVAFAEQGNALLSGSRDGSLRVWRALSFPEIEDREKRERVVR